MEKYFEAKKIFFDMLKPDACAVFNADDPYGSRIVESSSARKISYGIEQKADVRAEKSGLEHQRYVAGNFLREREAESITTPLIGRFNAYNVLSAAAAAFGLGISGEKIQGRNFPCCDVRGVSNALHHRKDGRNC